MSLGDQTKLKIARKEETSNGRWPQNIKSETTEERMIKSYSYFKIKLRWQNQNWKLLERRQPQNIKSGLSQQPLIRSYWNLKLKLPKTMTHIS